MIASLFMGQIQCYLGEMRDSGVKIPEVKICLEIAGAESSESSSLPTRVF